MEDLISELLGQKIPEVANLIREYSEIDIFPRIVLVETPNQPQKGIFEAESTSDLVLIIVDNSHLLKDMKTRWDSKGIDAYLIGGQVKELLSEKLPIILRNSDPDKILELRLIKETVRIMPKDQPQFDFPLIQWDAFYLVPYLDSQVYLLKDLQDFLIDPCQWNQKTIITLIGRGWNINKLSFLSNLTPLEASLGNYQLTKLLLEHGANPNLSLNLVYLIDRLGTGSSSSSSSSSVIETVKILDLHGWNSVGRLKNDEK